MHILILNGSPAGDDSITLQTLRYIQKLFPGHEWAQLPVARRWKALAKDFSEAREKLEKAELLIFSYPVYTFLAPAQLHRFISLMKGSGVDLRGKYATQLTTSKHFYDVTAHEYIRLNCADLGLKYLRGLSADMEDLLTEKGQGEARAFFARILWAMERGIDETLPGTEAPFAPAPATAPPRETPKDNPKEVVVVADMGPEDKALAAMVERFRRVCTSPSRVVNIRDFAFAGGCLGCFRCAASGQCFYTDGFDKLLREEIQRADATVYAFTVRDHSMGCQFKFYDDRQFCNGHRTVTMGKPVGYLVDGPLSKEPSLRMLLEARAQVGGNHLSWIAGNEGDTDGEVDRLASELDYDLRSGYRESANFYGVGGMKIFRDLIFTMQGLMREDHRFYKKHGFYKDFPQRHRGKIAAMYLVGGLMNNPRLSKKLGPNMTKGMLMPYENVLKKVK